MLQMMADTSRITHTGSGNDDLGGLVKIDGLGFLTGDGQLQSRKCNGVDALFHIFHSLVIKALITILLKYTGGLHRHGTVHIHREILMSFDQTSHLDFPQEIQDLLSTAHRKGRNHHITATIQCLLQYLCQFRHIV